MDKIHVQAPVAVIFLCGGRTSDVSDPTPLSIRDAFLKIVDNPALRDRKYILAEDVKVFYLSRSAYRDFLRFEVDLAQITELVVLFCESAGSLVEFGAFSMLPEIAERLFVVMRDRHYKDESFVRLGPALSLQNDYGDSVIYVIDDDDINIVGGSPSHINKENLRDRLNYPITQRITQVRQPTTFDANRSGHIIKLIVGLIQEYGALTISEISTVLSHISIDKSPNEISAYLLCAESIEWIRQEKKGLNTYFFALPIPDAATLVMKDTAVAKPKVRRRQIIREYWRDTDLDRYRGIVQFMGGRL